MNNRTIAILMATYNGERFLGEQIDSLLLQTYKDWHLYVHDDGSNDDTIAIVKKYIHYHPDKITLLDYPPQGGPCRNFLSMLDKVEAPYYMFCDQDDVWLKEKIELSMKEMEHLEADNAQSPFVVHTDLKIVDAQLSVIHHSMWAFSAIYPAYIKTFDDAAGHTVLATGCTMLFNQRAKAACLAYSSARATMHDCWLCLCTLRQGGILHGLDRQTVLYRQHGNNCLGSGSTEAKAVNLSYRMQHLGKMYQSNKRYYAMLSSLGYGSLQSYIVSKIKYKIRIKRGRY